MCDIYMVCCAFQYLILVRLVQLLLVGLEIFKLSPRKFLCYR